MAGKLNYCQPSPHSFTVSHSFNLIQSILFQYLSSFLHMLSVPHNRICSVPLRLFVMQCFLKDFAKTTTSFQTSTFGHKESTYISVTNIFFSFSHVEITGFFKLKDVQITENIVISRVQYTFLLPKPFCKFFFTLSRHVHDQPKATQ